jgi:Tol biopolymer transport system component
LFFSLDTDQRLAMFEELANPQQVGQDALAVVVGVYQDSRLEDNAEDNRLLRAMANALHQVEGVSGAEATALEIDYWMTGRERSAEGDYAAAVEQYTLALGLNDRNASVLLDRGQAYAGLGKYEDALTDLLKVAELDPERETAVQRAIEQDAGLFTYVGQHRQEYQAIAALFPTLTPTPTPTNIPVNTPTSTNTLTPTLTATPTSPTSTQTPVPIPACIAFASTRDGGEPEIYVMNTDGSNPTRLTNDPTHYDQHPSWSPDGSHIAFESDRDGNFEIYIMNSDGSGQFNLTDNPARDWEPDWSPNGNNIAFASWRDGDSNIYVMDADDGTLLRLTNSSGQNENPAWSPDGSRIAFSSTRDGDQEVYVMNADGSNQVRLTNSPGVDRSLTWSSDGTQIAFISQRDGRYWIYVMSADGSGVTPLLADGLPWIDNPTWSPDGRKIAFRSIGVSIYVVNADGSNRVRLTTGDHWDGDPDWSPVCWP